MVFAFADAIFLCAYAASSSQFSPPIRQLTESTAMTAKHSHLKRNFRDARPSEMIDRVSRRLAAAMLVSITLASGTGCRLCCDLEDAAYSAYGGAWERTNRESGRVGSLFDPAGAKVADLAPRDSTGDKTDAIERIAPGLKAEADKLKNDPSLERTVPKIKSEEETEQEFQERLRKFKEEKEKLLNAGVIPGQPQPPEIR